MSTTMDLEQGTTQAKGQAPATTSDVVLVTADPSPNEGCQCTAGWVLFGVGWVMPLCWLVGAFLPFCTKNRNDKRAAIGSGVMILVYGLVLGLVLGLYVVPLIALTHTLGSTNHSASNWLAAQMAAAGQLSPVPAPPQTAAPSSSPVVATAGVTTDLTCYQAMGNSTVQAVRVNNSKAEPLFCAKYSITCTPQDMACTAAQAAAQAVVWIYLPAAQSTCTMLASMPPIYMGLVCCTTDLCNVPDPAADSVTRVLPGVVPINWA